VIRSVVVALICVCLTLGGCQAGEVQVDTYPTTKGSRVDCMGLLDDLPPTVAGQPRRLVKGRVAGAWGDPPIVLRCGVEKPEALRPTSTCHEIDGVGWLAEKQSDGYLFTTIGRRLYVSLEVPAEYQPAADALTDVADLVSRHLPEHRPCA
jgi:hypothetical protein